MRKAIQHHRGCPEGRMRWINRTRISTLIIQVGGLLKNRVKSEYPVRKMQERRPGCDYTGDRGVQDRAPSMESGMTGDDSRPCSIDSRDAFYPGTQKAAGFRSIQHVASGSMKRSGTRHAINHSRGFVTAGHACARHRGQCIPAFRGWQRSHPGWRIIRDGTVERSCPFCVGVCRLAEE